MADADIIRSLQPLKWKGLLAPPYDIVTFKFQNTLAPRTVAYVDGDIHDDIGRRSFPMTARLYFINTLFHTLGVRMFPDYWETWKATFDGSPGDLDHPVLGPLRARVQEVSGELRSSTVAGIIVDVSWIETLEDPALPSYLGVLQVDVETLAADADAACAEFDVTFPTGRHETTLYEAILAVKGSIFAFEVTMNAAVNSIGHAIDVMIDALGLQDSPETLPASDMLMALHGAVFKMYFSALKAARPTSSKVTRADTTLDTFAAQVGNTTHEIMGLNPAALRKPTVSRGTTLVYYTG